MIIIVLGISLLLIVGLIYAMSLKSEELTMSKLRNIYLYLVSFVSLMMILIGLIFTVQNITDVIFPTNYYNEYIPPDKSGQMSEEDRKAYEENQKINEQNRKTESKKNVAKSTAVVLVALPTFLYHWKKIEKEKKEQKEQI